MNYPCPGHVPDQAGRGGPHARGSMARAGGLVRAGDIVAGDMVAGGVTDGDGGGLASGTGAGTSRRRDRARIGGGFIRSIQHSGRRIRAIWAGAACISATISGSCKRDSRCPPAGTASGSSGRSQPIAWRRGIFGLGCGFSGVRRGATRRGRHVPAATRAARRVSRCLARRRRSMMPSATGPANSPIRRRVITAWLSHRTKAAKASAGGLGGTVDTPHC